VELFSRADRTDDATLVAGFALGDEGASTAFVRRFQDSVFGLALSVTRDRGLAEDVAQEVFARAWRAAGSYDARRASVRTWLLTITRNAAIDAIRMRRPVPHSDETLDGLVAATNQVDSSEHTGLVSLEAARALERIRALPPQQSLAVIMAVIGGCTADQISRAESIPLGTAKTRIRTGLRRLRETLKEESR